MTELVLTNPLKQRIESGGLGVCLLIRQARTVDLALAAKTCGYDAINLDLEHSAMSEETCAQICAAALLAGVAPLVRVAGHNWPMAARVLDAGALGVIVPHIGSAQEARAAVQAVRFPPLGERSVAGTYPHFSYASHPAGPTRRLLESQTMLICMVETPEAIERADEIAAVPGVDMVHMGSSDLCETFGVPGQYGDPRIAQSVEKLVAACRKHGKIAGLGGMGGELALIEKFVAMGIRFVTAGNEWAFMMAAAKERASKLRGLKVG